MLVALTALVAVLMYWVNMSLAVLATTGDVVGVAVAATVAVLRPW